MTTKPTLGALELEQRRQRIDRALEHVATLALAEDAGHPDAGRALEKARAQFHGAELDARSPSVDELLLDLHTNATLALEAELRGDEREAYVLWDRTGIFARRLAALAERGKRRALEIDPTSPALFGVPPRLVPYPPLLDYGDPSTRRRPR